MPRNIVILFDGTSNEIAADRTNILRLYGTLEKSPRQLVWYDPGVGTLGVTRSWLRYWRKATEIFGMVTGWGIDDNVKEAYQFLIENHVRALDKATNTPVFDHIHIFGFSRGAYSARVLAGLIHAVGLLEPRNINLIDYAYRAYKRIDDDREAANNPSLDEVRLYQRILRPIYPPIRLLGLFDTVASVIENGRYLPKLATSAFTTTNRSVQSIRHAVAMDERRTMFRAMLWRDGQIFHSPVTGRDAAQDLREVWFSGVHGDVGGGYPEMESGLAKIPLRWMIEQTAPLGLHFDAAAVQNVVLDPDMFTRHTPPDWRATAHDSMNWAWAILEFLPRRRPKDSRRPQVLGWCIPWFEPRPIPPGARIHRSVLERIQAGGPTPSNLPDDYLTED